MEFVVTFLVLISLIGVLTLIWWADVDWQPRDEHIARADDEWSPDLRSTPYSRR